MTKDSTQVPFRIFFSRLEGRLFTKGFYKASTALKNPFSRPPSEAKKNTPLELQINLQRPKGSKFKYAPKGNFIPVGAMSFIALCMRSSYAPTMIKFNKSKVQLQKTKGNKSASSQMTKFEYKSGRVQKSEDIKALPRRWARKLTQVIIWNKCQRVPNPRHAL